MNIAEAQRLLTIINRARNHHVLKPDSIAILLNLTLTSRPHLTNVEICANTSMTDHRCAFVLRELQLARLVEIVGKTPNRAKLWRITANGEDEISNILST